MRHEAAGVTTDRFPASFELHGQQLKLSAEFADIKFDVQNPDNPAQRDYKQFTAGVQFIF